MHGTLLSVCLFVCCVSADWSRDVIKGFHYVHDLGIIYRRASSEDCRICDGDENCLSLDEARCEYYIESSTALQGNEDSEDESDSAPELRAEVDSIMYSLADKASMDPRFKDCLPFISVYTNCHKENICTGCTTCICDTEGLWNCTTKQQCKPDPAKDINHRALLLLLDKFKGNHKLSKRSIIDDKHLSKEEKVKYEDLIEWMYGDRPVHHNYEDKQKTEYQSEKLSNLLKRSVTSDTITEEKINFDDLFGMLNPDGERADVNIMSDHYNASPTTMKTLIVEKQTTQYPNEKLSNLVKRSIINETTTEEKINFDELFGWLNPDDQPTDTSNTTVEASSNVTTMETPVIELHSTTMSQTKTEPEFLSFEEVLNIIAFDNKNDSGRKLSLDTKQNEKVISNDYVDFDDEPFIFYKGSNLTDNTTNYGVTEPTLVDIFTEEVTKSVINEVTTIVTDLLDSANVSKETNNNFLFFDYVSLDNELDIPTNESNQIESNSLNAVNVMKREVKVTNNTIETTSLASVNTSQHDLIDPILDLDGKVLDPLKRILNDKRKEIYDLIKIKDNLITFMKTNKFVLNNNESVIDKKIPSYLSNYNLELAPPIDVELRRSNTSILDKYMTKLEHDVNEVIRDIVNIQKYTDLNKLPENIKFLTRAMKFYVHKNGFHKQKNIGSKQRSSVVKINRRNWDTIDLYNQNPIVYSIIRILELIDKNMPTSNALQPLSKTTRKVMKRLCKQNYVDQYSIIGQRVYDPHYNLTDDIKNIGTQWQQTSPDIDSTPLSERLYHFKLLHLVLSNDINKMNNALALIDFAHSRRMVPIDDNLGEELMSKINNNLKSIDRKIMAYVKRNNIIQKTKNKEEALRRKTKNHKKKDSFMNQIKKLLRNSKTDIRKLLHKNVPQTLIVKELAKKSLNRLTKRKLSEYEQTMRKWQNNMKIPTGRQKRSSVFSKRMKSIIPKYLRGKVNYTAHKKKGRKVHSTTTKPIITMKKMKKFH